MRFRKRCLSFLICLVLCFVSFSSTTLVLAATHYILLGHGYHQSSIPVDYEGVGSSYMSYWNIARNAWNNSGAGVSIIPDSNSTNTISTKSFPNQTYYGKYNWSPLFVKPSGRVSSFTIIINTAQCPPGYMCSTMVHEFGHAFNLDDNPCNQVGYYNSSIMNYGRSRDTLRSPTVWDIEGVQASY